MLISRSNNFVFIRVPKTGSTSALFYFLNSGLYNAEKDTVAIDGNFTSWMQMQKHFNTYQDDYLEKHQEFVFSSFSYSVDRNVHCSYSDLLMQKRIENETPCFSIIRNPFDRLCSIYFYQKKQIDELGGNAQTDSLNEFCYKACIKGEKTNPDHAKRLQSSYFPDHAKLWNTENLYDHAKKDIIAMGGKVSNSIHVRKTSQEPKDYKSMLSFEIIQMIEAKFVGDFEIWEKAYAVYN